MNKDIASIRTDYQMASLEEVNTAEHPMTQFEHWWEDAIASNIYEVNAFVLSTIMFLVCIRYFEICFLFFLKNYTNENICSNCFLS